MNKIWNVVDIIVLKIFCGLNENLLRILKITNINIYITNTLILTQ